MEHASIPSLQELTSAAAAIGLALAPWQASLSRLHVQELLRWNETTSLIRVGSAQEMLARHLVEGWLAAQLLPPGPGLSVLDVGSGGGIPGLPMHVARPDVRLSLVEPRFRKAAFLRHVARQHPEPRPVVLECRLEEVDARQRWDAISFRGIDLAPADVLGHLEPSGCVIRFPGRAESEADWEAAGLRRAAVRELPTRPLRVERWECRVDGA